jgi:hypothetical protein
MEVEAGPLGCVPLEELLTRPGHSTEQMNRHSSASPASPASLQERTGPGSPSADGWPRTSIGEVTGFAGSGLALVDFPGNPQTEPLPARAACPIAPADVGREAALVFENGDPRKPIILGLLQPAAPLAVGENAPQPVSVGLDGEQVTLTAKNEIVLRCGKASITLTRAGKVLIRGAYLLSRSSGANRIKGGSVQIN